MKYLKLISSTLSKVSPGWFRLFLAVVVVLFHTSRFVFFGFWAVFVFFILSGYWIAEMYREKYSRVEKPFISFELSRLLRIVPTFLACSVLAAIVIAFGYGDIAPSFLRDPFWVVRSLAILGSSSMAPRLIETQWSLDIELQFYLLFPLLYATLRKPNAAKVCFCILYLMLSIGLFRWPHSLAVYLPFFLSGIAISEFRWRSSDWLLSSSILIGFAVFGLILINPESRSSILSYGRVDIMGQNVTHVLDVLLALLALPFISINVRNKESQLSTHAGNLSYPLYLAHWVMLGPYIASYGGRSMLERLPFFFGYLLVSFAVSLAIYFLVDRPVDAWRRAFIKSQTKPSTSNSQPSPTHS